MSLLTSESNKSVLENHFLQYLGRLPTPEESDYFQRMANTSTWADIDPLIAALPRGGALSTMSGTGSWGLSPGLPGTFGTAIGSGVPQLPPIPGSGSGGWSGFFGQIGQQLGQGIINRTFGTPTSGGGSSGGAMVPTSGGPPSIPGPTIGGGMDVPGVGEHTPATLPSGGLPTRTATGGIVWDPRKGWVFRNTKMAGARNYDRKVTMTKNGWAFRSRRMNVLNPQALHRADRRVRGFANLAKGMLHAFGFSVHTTRKLGTGKKRRRR